MTPRRATASRLNTITRTRARRRVTRTQSATRSRRPTRRHAVTRLTTPISSAEPGMDKTKNKAMSWASAPYPRVVSIRAMSRVTPTFTAVASIPASASGLAPRKACMDWLPPGDGRAAL